MSNTEAKAFIAKYENDPIGFGCDVLDINPDHVWPKMVEVSESVRDHQKTCVFAGHGVSKTYNLARIVLWFLYTHIPSTVITTAPIFDQVEKLLWKEIHTAHSQAKIPLGGKMTKTQLDLDPDQKWFAYGFSTKADTVTGEATRMQGYHNKHVLIVFDEAAGIPAAIWKATESLLTDGNCKIVAVGNPTSATGSFAECEEDPSWNFVRISVKDSPNYKEGRQVVPEISGRDYEAMMRRKYGEESAEYGIRVDGRKPEFTLGTYLGRGLAKAEEECRIGVNGLYDSAAPVYTFSDLGDMYSAFWFVQFIKEQIRFIDFYYDGEGKGLPAYAVMFQEKRYKYGSHFSLPDIFKGGSNQKAGVSGQYTIDIAHSLGIDFERIDIPNRSDCIHAAQGIMDKCLFDTKAQEGVDGLTDWRKRKNEALSTPEKPVYYDEAMKTWGRHVGDAFCGVAVCYRYLSIGGEVLGTLTPSQPDTYQKPIYTNTNTLTRGMAKTG